MRYGHASLVWRRRRSRREGAAATGAVAAASAGGHTHPHTDPCPVRAGAGWATGKPKHGVTGGSPSSRSLGVGATRYALASRSSSLLQTRSPALVPNPVTVGLLTELRVPVRQIFSDAPVLFHETPQFMCEHDYFYAIRCQNPAPNPPSAEVRIAGDQHVPGTGAPPSNLLIRR